MIMENFVVIMEVSDQISEDRWSVSKKTFAATESTTIGEIYNWYRLRFTAGPMYVEISQTESPQP